jgi:hypothetical protein
LALVLQKGQKFAFGSVKKQQNQRDKKGTKNNKGKKLIKIK